MNDDDRGIEHGDSHAVSVGAGLFRESVCSDNGATPYVSCGAKRRQLNVPLHPPDALEGPDLVQCRGIDGSGNSVQKPAVFVSPEKIVTLADRSRSALCPKAECRQIGGIFLAGHVSIQLDDDPNIGLTTM